MIKPLRTLFWPLFFTAHLLTCCLIAWHLCAQINFAYPLGYKLLDLETHIAELAPRNRFKQGFELTRPEDHWRLFGQITQAVQSGGEGLAEISYKLPNGENTPLMHKAEIIHLEDVSHLISRFYSTGLYAFILWIFCCALAYQQKLCLPSLRNIVLGFLGGVFILSSIVLSLGATDVFYWFHTKVFPEGHQWFFYYEDSLMTTLMKAPDIFAFIGLLLLIVLLVLWGISIATIAKLFRVRPNNGDPINRDLTKVEIKRSSSHAGSPKKSKKRK